MNIKKIIFYIFFAIFPLNYSLFCPKEIKLREVKLINDTTWSTSEIFYYQDGVIRGFYFPKIQLFLRGPNIIVVTGPHKLFLVDLTILPNDPDVLSIEDTDAELILENCTFILDGKNLNLDVKNIEIIGNIEFVGLNPGIIKRALGSIVSFFSTQALTERFVLDYPLVTFPSSVIFTKGDESAKFLFERTIFERDWLSKKNQNKKPKRVHFENPVST